MPFEQVGAEGIGGRPSIRRQFMVRHARDSVLRVHLHWGDSELPNPAKEVRRSPEYSHTKIEDHRNGERVIIQTESNFFRCGRKTKGKVGRLWPTWFRTHDGSHRMGDEIKDPVTEDGEPDDQDGPKIGMCKSSDTHRDARPDNRSRETMRRRKHESTPSPA